MVVTDRLGMTRKFLVKFTEGEILRKRKLVSEEDDPGIPEDSTVSDVTYHYTSTV